MLETLAVTRSHATISPIAHNEARTSISQSLRLREVMFPKVTGWEGEDRVADPALVHTELEWVVLPCASSGWQWDHSSSCVIGWRRYRMPHTVGSRELSVIDCLGEKPEDFPLPNPRPSEHCPLSYRLRVINHPN